MKYKETTKMEKKYYVLSWLLTLILLASLRTTVLAQETSPTIPDGFGSNELQTTENLSSGVLNINLPIESYLVPVSISYNTSGIRVSERAGVVGLGWNLNAGGRITRQKRGVADDRDNGYSGYNKRGNQVRVNMSDTEFWRQAVVTDNGDNWDSHPDIFYFNFLNYSGQFALATDLSVVKLTPNNLKIEAVYDATQRVLVSFTITDEQGNQYLFLKNSIKSKVFMDGSETASYISDWNLVQISEYGANSTINFKYEAGPEYRETNTFNYKRSGSHGDGSSEIEHVSTPMLLKKIYFVQDGEVEPESDSYVEFIYSDRATAVAKKKLDTISYTVNGGKKVSYFLDYAYLGESDARRLMLSSVRKSTLDLKLYQFLYFGQSANEGILPEYDSNQKDHWGYFNANGSDDRFQNFGANLSPNAGLTQANALKRIYHTAGGYTEYHYELNDYLKDNVEKTAGGLRISKITKGDYSGNEYTVKTYYYLSQSGVSSGVLYSEPSYSVNRYASGGDYTEYRENSFQPLRDHMGRHITYKTVSVVLVNGSREVNEFYTFSDDLQIGTGANDDPSEKRWEVLDGVSTQPYNPLYPGPFGYKSFHGSRIGSIKEKTSFDQANRQLSSIEYLYTHIPSNKSVLGMNFSTLGGGWLNIDFYQLGDGYMQLDETRSTVYDLNDQNKFITTVTAYEYHNDHHLPVKTTVYQVGDQASNTIETNTTYLFEQSVDAESANLLAAVKTQSSKKGTQVLTSQTNVYSSNSNGKLVLESQEGYAYDAGLPYTTADQSYVYSAATNRVLQVTDNISGAKSAQIWDDNGLLLMAEISNAAPQECAFSSFEGKDAGNWYIYGYGPLDLTEGLIGDKAYQLSVQNIKKTLTAGKEYMLSYWYKSGGVSLSGLTQNQLISTRSLDGWTFEERLISRNSAGDLTLSGSGVIDHLSLFPKEALMSSYTYHSMFGKTSETDPNNNTVFYEYDEAGRVSIVRDKYKDIISTKDYVITNFLSVSASQLSTTYVGVTKQVWITSNGNWTSSSNGWVTISPNSGSGTTLVDVTIHYNSASSERTSNIYFNAGSTSKSIQVTQGAAPEKSIEVPSSIQMVSSATVNVLSNTSWTATITQDETGGMRINNSSQPINGSGSDSFVVTVPFVDPDTTYAATIRVQSTDGSVVRTINISINQGSN